MTIEMKLLIIYLYCMPLLGAGLSFFKHSFPWIRIAVWDIVQIKGTSESFLLFIATTHCAVPYRMEIKLVGRKQYFLKRFYENILSRPQGCTLSQLSSFSPLGNIHFLRKFSLYNVLF